MGADARWTTNMQFRCQEYVFELVGDAEMVAELEALFVDLTTEPVVDPHHWEIERFRGHARSITDRVDAGEWVRRPDFPAAVISKLTMTVIAAQPGLLHLHAGAVVADGATILLLAPSGSGKTTLTCALVSAGARYRTDEVVAVDRQGHSVITYPKPLSVKESGIAVVEEMTGLTCPPGATSWELPASAFGAVAPGDDDPVTTIVFNSYMPAQPALLEPMHRATAVRCILADSQDVELVGPDALVTAARLAGAARCLRATGGDASAMARLIREAHRGPLPPAEVVSVPAVSSVRGSRAADVGSVVIDGRAVLYTPAPHHLVELDEGQTVWWLLLDGTPFDRIVDEVAEASGVSRAEVAVAGGAIVERFRSLGVLSDP